MRARPQQGDRRTGHSAFGAAVQSGRDIQRDSMAQGSGGGLRQGRAIYFPVRGGAVEAGLWMRVGGESDRDQIVSRDRRIGRSSRGSIELINGRPMREASDRPLAFELSSTDSGDAATALALLRSLSTRSRTSPGSRTSYRGKPFIIWASRHFPKPKRSNG